MKQIIVGTWYSGFEQIQLILRPGTGGEFYPLPACRKVPKITLGADHNQWWEVMDALLHEVMEFNLMRLNCRYKKTERMSSDLSMVTFMFNHPEFSEATARSAEYCADALPVLFTAWKEWQRRSKKKKGQL